MRGRTASVGKAGHNEFWYGGRCRDIRPHRAEDRTLRDRTLVVNSPQAAAAEEDIARSAVRAKPTRTNPITTRTGAVTQDKILAFPIRAFAGRYLAV